MANLPQGWEWDYDGKRWFYKYKPTGHIQYHFPKEGDEFPDFVDAAEPAPILAPEERLESQQQLKRQTTVGGSHKPRETLSPDSASSSGRKNGMTATARPVSAVWDGDGENEEAVFQPENFMFLGPGTYVDVSPLNDEEDEAAKRSVVGIEQRVESSPGNKVVSPAESSLGTPMTKKSEPAQSPQPADATVSSETRQVIDGGMAVAETETPGVPDDKGPENNGQAVQEFVIIASEDILEQPADEVAISSSFDPVGIVAEMATDDTAMAHIERNPDPVEIGDNTILAPIETAAPLGIAELPGKNSPIEGQTACATKSDPKPEHKEDGSEVLKAREDPSENIQPEHPKPREDNTSSDGTAKSKEPKIQRKPTVLAEAAGSVAYRAYKPSNTHEQTCVSDKQSMNDGLSGQSTEQSAASETQKTSASPVAAQGDHWTVTEQPSDPRLAHIPSVLKPANRKTLAKDTGTKSDKSPASEGEEVQFPEKKSPAPSTSAEQKPPVAAQAAASVDIPPVGSKEENREPLSDPEEPKEHTATQEIAPEPAPVQPLPFQQPMLQQPPISSQTPVQGVTMKPGQMQANSLPIHTNTGPGPQYPPVAIPIAYNQYQGSRQLAPPQPAPPPWIPPGQQAPQHSMMRPPQPMVGQMHPPGWVPSMQSGYGQPPMQQPQMQRPPIPLVPAQQPPARMYASFASTSPSIPLSEHPVSRPMPQSTQPREGLPHEGPPRPQSVAGVSSAQSKHSSPITAAGQSLDHTPPLQGVRRSSTLDSSNISPLRPRTESQSSGLPMSSPSPMEQPVAPVTSVPNTTSAANSLDTKQDGNQNAQSSYFPPSKEQQPTNSPATPGKLVNGIMVGQFNGSSSEITSLDTSLPPKGADGDINTTTPDGITSSSGPRTTLGRIEERDTETASVSNNSIQGSKRHSLASSIQQSPVDSRPPLFPSQGSFGQGQTHSAPPSQGHMVMQSLANTAPMHPQGPPSSGPPMTPQTMPPSVNIPLQGFILQPGFSGPMQPGRQGASRPVSVQGPVQGAGAKEKDKKWTKWFKSSKPTKQPQGNQQQMPPGPPIQAPPVWNSQWQQPGPVPSGQPMQGHPHAGFPPNRFAPGPGASTIGPGPQGVPRPLGMGFQQVPPHVMQPCALMYPSDNATNAPPGPMIQPSVSPAPSQSYHSHHSNSPSVHSMASFQGSIQQQSANAPRSPQDLNLVPAPLFMGAKPGVSSPTGSPSASNPTDTSPAIQNGPRDVNKWTGQPVDYSGGGWGGDGR